MFSYTKRLGYVLVALAVVVLLGCDSQDPVDDEDPPEPDVQVTVAENDSLGEYLTDADGLSLYLFTDENGEPVPCTSDDCLAAWPPFLTEGEVDADGAADASLLDTTERPDGTTQVVYNGWPLYYFVNDNSPGDVNGQGIVSFGGTWLLISPAGEAVETSGENDDGDDDDDNGDDNGDDPRY